jgi:hypothetical protein
VKASCKQSSGFLLGLFFDREDGGYMFLRNVGAEWSLPPASAGFLLGLLFDPEHGGSIFLRNVGLPPNHSVATQKTIPS